MLKKALAIALIVVTIAGQTSIAQAATPNNQEPTPITKEAPVEVETPAEQEIDYFAEINSEILGIKHSIEEKKERIAELEKQVKASKITKEEKTAQVEKLTKEIKALSKNLKSLESKVKKLQSAITENLKAIEEMNSDLEKMFLPKTLQLMEEHDYVKESVTGLSDKLADVKTLNENLKSYGKLVGKGLPFKEYQEAMNYKWQDITDYDNKPVKINIDISKSFTYKMYVDTLKKLSRYDGVYLYKIGTSTDGRDLYSIEVDVDSDKQKQVILLTGQTHSREFAGGVYIVKQLSDLVQKAQTNKDTMNMLKEYKFVAVPIISLDVREGLINNPSKWTNSDKTLWKAYSNGVDGNRNYAGLQWGQISKGNSLKWNIKTKAGSENYAGDYAGSNNETKAMMKWFYHYIMIEKAIYHLDYHQQGRILYAGKPWQTETQFKKSVALANNITSVLSPNKKTYKYVSEEKKYGLQGEGSTATDFAVSLAVGAKFSPKYGFMTFVANNKEYTLMEVGDLDTTKLKIESSANPNFATTTIEIGYGTSYLGDSANTRKLLAKEYTTYNFDKLLEKIPTFIKNKK